MMKRFSCAGGFGTKTGSGLRISPKACNSISLIPSLEENDPTGFLFETWFKPKPQVPSMGKGLLPQLLNENIRGCCRAAFPRAFPYADCTAA